MKKVLRTRTFTRWMRKTGLADDTLCRAVSEMMQGLVDGDLGGNLLKKRISLSGRGKRGGGRIIGEGCHFIDLLAHLADSPVTLVSAMMVGGNSAIREDKMSILLSFADGSVGAVHYFANGARSYPKETLEIFGSGRVIRMENFRKTESFGFKGFNAFRTWRQDKGHRAEVAAFVSAVAAGGPSPIPFDQLVNVTKASFAAVESARTGKVVRI